MKFKFYDFTNMMSSYFGHKHLSLKTDKLYKAHDCRFSKITELKSQFICEVFIYLKGNSGWRDCEQF